MHERRLARHGSLEPTTRKRLSTTSLADHLDAYGVWDGECFVWTRSVRGHMGYGTVTVGGRVLAVHRVIWEMMHGPIPDGMMVLHHCDNPRCYRIDHLFLGSNQDNMNDMKSKGRYPKLTRDHMPHSKLSVEQAAEVVARYNAGGISQQQLANEYGCHQTTISDIIVKSR